jgi:hypothetical protein
MKSFLIAALLIVSGSAFANDEFAYDLSNVGSHSVEVTTQYTYGRATTPQVKLAAQEELVGLQLNEGALGSVFVEAGSRQKITTTRTNMSDFTVGYANGVKLGRVNVVGAASYTEFTSDVWFFGGKNSSKPTKDATVTVEANTPVNFVVSHYLVTVSPFVDYSRNRTWTTATSTTSATNAYGNVAAFGAYADLTKHVVAKVGYSRGWNASVHTEGVLASLNYRF